MRTEQPLKCFVSLQKLWVRWARKTSLIPPVIHYCPSMAVVLLWFSVARFGVRGSATFHLMYAHIISSSGWVAEWPPFGK